MSYKASDWFDALNGVKAKETGNSSSEETNHPNTRLKAIKH